MGTKYKSGDVEESGLELVGGGNREVWWERPLNAMTIRKFGDIQKSSSWKTKFRRVVESLFVTGHQKLWVSWRIM